MLRNIRNTISYKMHRSAAPAHRQQLRNPTPDTSLTEKIINVGKRISTICKFKVVSQTPLPAHSVESDSTFVLSDHTAATNILVLPDDIEQPFEVPFCSTMNDPVAAFPPPAASSEASTSVGTPAASTQTDITVPEDDETSIQTSEKLQYGFGKRLKAKYTKIMDSTTKALGNVFGDTNKTVNLPIESRELKVDGIDEESDKDEDGNDEDEDDSDASEHGDQPQHPRCDWNTIRAISNDQIKAVAQKHLPLEGDLQVTARTCGTYHLVAFIAHADPDHTNTEWIIRIPGHGTPSHWKEADAYILEREVQLVEHVRQNTQAPVPHILAYSSSCENELGSPFTLMTKLPGKSAYEVWFDSSYNPTYAFRTADVPSVATEKKRINFLRSLASTMTEIQKLSFDKIGMPAISEDGTIAVGPSYAWHDTEEPDEATEHCAFATTHAYTNTALVNDFVVEIPAEKTRTSCYQSGTRDILDIVFSQSVFNEGLSAPETFTIHHNDLDLQNILVDDEGNVTGIIDWDNAYAAPRCIGAAAVPIFLRSDWFPRYTHALNITPHMGWNEQHYREIYAAAMVEAGNPDAKYTSKSAIYQACIAAIYEGGDHEDLIEKLVRCIPDCRIDIDDLKVGLGMGWSSAEEMLQRQFTKILEPQLPRSGLIKELEDELTLKEWWTGFDDLLWFLDEETWPDDPLWDDPAWDER
ncbi:hypothetical protein E8E13_005730 [Curvularia kusanoi]|uniref:Aminoglycoside phosphotransferase domain-containing protein n=1 Tax=Curvularia kusanoi TaxID=90978 RepID=A0A9P4WB87_CURKU|nr:hypothetical protein E8E13_005730 [Curvularia kusanoi]